MSPELPDVPFPDTMSTVPDVLLDSPVLNKIAPEVAVFAVPTAVARRMYPLFPESL
jgi:hypothetical protein